MTQHMDALARANEVRLWLADQRRAVHGGDIDLWTKLCLSHDKRLQSVAIADFLQWLPGIGVQRARSIVHEQFVWPTISSEKRVMTSLDDATATRLCEAVHARLDHTKRVMA